jgi:molybdopterin-binding protein
MVELTARNQLKGTVVSVSKGPVSALVKLDVGGGQHVSATVTTEAVEQLGIAEGRSARAIFKASSVIIGVD